MLWNTWFSLKKSVENIDRSRCSSSSFGRFSVHVFGFRVERIFTLHHIRTRVFEVTSLGIQPQKGQGMSSHGSLSAKGGRTAERDEGATASGYL